MERGIDRARSIARGTGGVGETVPRLLASALWLRSPAGPWSGGSGGSDSGFFCPAFGTKRPRCGAPRERTFAFLSAGVAQTFSDQRATPCDGDQARRRSIADSAGGTEERGARCSGADRQFDGGPHL